MIVDGKALTEKVKTALREEILRLQKSAGQRLRLAVVQIGHDAATEKFLEQKKKFAEAIGVEVKIYELPPDISTRKMREKVSELVHIPENTGIIVQLPLPRQVNTQYILDAIIPEKDPDLLSSKSLGAFAAGKFKVLPTVVGAIQTIFEEYKVGLTGKRVLIIGAGRLVGRPVASWLLNQKVTVSIIDENTPRPEEFIREADVIISGVGKPGLLGPEVVKPGAVVIDAGTSESPLEAGRPSSGKIVGDVDPKVSEKASLFSPVPGGVGPLTVAMLFKNLIELSK